MINHTTLLNNQMGKVLEFPGHVVMTYVSATTFDIEGDWTSIITARSMIRVTNSTNKNGIIRTATLSGSNTRILAYWDVALANSAITAVKVAKTNVPTNHTTWVEYGTTWASTGTQPAIGNGSITSVCAVYGDIVWFDIKLIAGTTTTYGTGTYTFTIPFNESGQGGANNYTSVTGYIVDGGVATYGIIGRIGDNASTVVLARVATGITADAAVTATNPITLGSTDTININGWYTAP